MRLLLLIICILKVGDVFAEEVKFGRLPADSGSFQINAAENLPDVWVFEREYNYSDARALSLFLNAPAGTVAWFELVNLSTSSKLIKNREKTKRRRIEKLRAGSRKAWRPEFILANGKISPYLEARTELNNEVEGLAFLFPDACARSATYLIRAVIDFRNSATRNFPVYIEFAQSRPPKSQATLFKYPSEKSAAHAVILMRTSGVGPKYLHFTAVSNGVPREVYTVPVEEYYFSNLGVFTRVYMGGEFLNGQRVSMHHISPDFTSIYSVCVSLQRMRQELEGYP